MNYRLRIGVVLASVYVLSLAFMALATAPSRTRVQSAADGLVALSESEVDLSERMVRIQAEQAFGQILPDDLKWLGSDSASVEIAMQQTLVDLAGTNGLQAVSFGVAQSPSEIKSSTNAYEIELEGGHAEVAQFIADVEQHMPPLAISFLWIRQMPAALGQIVAPVNVRMTVWGFSAAPVVAK